VPGTFAYKPAAGTVLAAGTYTLRATFTPADTKLYTTASASTTLVVTGPVTTPKVSWAAPAAITEGTPLGAAQLNASASAPGTFVYVPAAGTILPAGTHTLRAAFTPADTTLYAAASASTTLVVTAVRTTPVVSWAMPAAITQGTPLGAAQLNASASVPGTFVYDPAAGTVLAAGTYTLRAVFTPADRLHYTTASVMTALVVNAPPTERRPASESSTAPAAPTPPVDPQTFQLTVVRPTGGTIWAAGITCGTRGIDCTESMPTAVWLGLQATADPGYAFTGWTGDCSGTQPSFSLALTGPRTCSATFTAVK